VEVLAGAVELVVPLGGTRYFLWTIFGERAQFIVCIYVPFMLSFPLLYLYVAPFIFALFYLSFLFAFVKYMIFLFVFLHFFED
jgi:hypothetical protein